MKEWGKKYLLSALILVLWSMVGITLGADLTDTTYSLGNYQNFLSVSNEWAYATYLANAVGFLFLKLAAGRMLVMNLLCSFVIAATGMVAYFGFRKIIPEKCLFLGELIAIGLCWCPRVILYNYLTYLFLTLGAVLVYLGVVREKKKYLFAAGIVLGLNVFTRISNLTEMALILLVWYGAFLYRDNIEKRNLWMSQTFFCIGGYLVGLAGGIGLMLCLSGGNGYAEMVQWLFSLFTSGEDAGGYSFHEMILTIVDNYFGNLKWFLVMFAGILLGTGMFALPLPQSMEKTGKFTKKIIYFVGILLLFIYFYRNGVFDFIYTNNGSIYRLCVLCFLVEMVICTIILVGKKYDKQDKLLALLVWIILLITPLGSNNHLFTCINNMFLLSPIGIYLGKILCDSIKGKTMYFPVKSMLVALLLVLLVQSSMFHVGYVFRDGVNGEKRDTVLHTPDRFSAMNGMRTNRVHAEAILGLMDFAESDLVDQQLILYGDIPGVSYMLGLPVAISTSWPDLDSFSAEQFRKDLEAAGQQVTLILSKASRLNMESNIENGVENEKDLILMEFMEEHEYQLVYSNEEFLVYQ